MAGRNLSSCAGETDGVGPGTGGLILTSSVGWQEHIPNPNKGLELNAVARLKGMRRKTAV
jgi:hypothetical protein